MHLYTCLSCSVTMHLSSTNLRFDKFFNSKGATLDAKQSTAII